MKQRKSTPLELHKESQPLLSVHKVLKRFGEKTILDEVSFQVEKGQVFCLLGPSGSGKSTLLRCIDHLEPIHGGEIRLNGERLGYRERKGKLVAMNDREASEMRTHIGMVFQHFNLFPHLTALENVALAPMRVMKLNKYDAEARAKEVLATVGLADFCSSFPSQLSGGQQQRVAIARAVVMEPSVVLFDEPTSALDPELVGEVLVAMKRLAESGMTMIIVSHEVGFARDVGDMVALMECGRIVESGPPYEVFGKGEGFARTREFVKRII